jgi:hypothetical protein
VLSVQWNNRRDSESFSTQELSVQVPRIVGVSHRIMESAVRRMITDTRENTAYTLFRWQAVVAAREQAAILDSGLRDRFHRFVRQCYWPARAVFGILEDSVDPSNVSWVELPVYGPAVRYRDDMVMEWMGSTVSCDEQNRSLLQALQRHLEDNPVHRFALQAAVDELGKSGAPEGTVTTQYLARILYNETFTKIRENEIARLREALPEYHKMDQRFFATAEPGTWGQGVSGMLSFFGGIAESASQETLGPTLYYRMTLYAPYLYGFLQAVWLMAFPVAALWSLWPGCYKVLVHYVTSWASIKIWPVFWSWLSQFNVGRLSLPAEDPLGLAGTGGSAAMFTAIAAMYVLVPAITLLLFNLAAQSGMVSFSNFVGSGSGAGPALGTMASAGSAAGRGAALASHVLERGSGSS